MRRLVLGVLVVAAISGGCVSTVDDALEGADDGGGAEPRAEGAVLSVHAIDVGQADATLIEAPGGETILVDTGHWQDDGEPVLAYLEDRDVDRIDHLVSTHAHADHIGGAAAVIEHYETERDGVGAVWDSGVAHTTATYEGYLDAIDAHDVTLYETQAGDEIPIEGATATVLNPPARRHTDDLDENSVAVHVEHGRTAFLFTGDAGRATESRLVDERGDQLGATVYQAGHHGSDSSSSAEFLDAVDPRVAIVSSAADSEYGHPHEEPLARLADRGIDVYWTGVHGTIVAESDGASVTVSTVANATVDPVAIHDASPAEAAATDEVTVRRVYPPDGASGLQTGEAPRVRTHRGPTAAAPALQVPATGGEHA